jgi:hypothetical protein
MKRGGRYSGSAGEGIKETSIEKMLMVWDESGSPSITGSSMDVIY